MQKLDRLGWAAGVAFEVFGVTIGIRVTDASVLDRVRSILPWGWVDSPATEVDWLYSVVAGGGLPGGKVRRSAVVYTDALQLTRTPDIDQALETLQRDLTLMAGELARNRVLVHAGVVGLGASAVLFPGRTLTGKSTLVASLVRAGAEYYSDEFAVLDDNGLVHPFTRPLSIRPHPTLKGIPTPPEALGGRVGTQPISVSAVVFTSFREGARWRARALTPGRCVLGLLDNCLAARSSPEFVLPVLQKVAEGARAVRTPRGEASEVVGQILRLAREASGP